MSHSSWNALEGWGQREPPAIWAIFWSWELLRFGSSLFSYFLFIHSHFHPFFRQLTNMVCRIFFGSQPVVQIISWHLEIFTCETAAVMKHQKNNRDQFWPWKMNMTSICTAACHFNSNFVFSTCFLLVKITWHSKEERDLRLKKEDSNLRHLVVTEINKIFCLECILHTKKLIKLRLNEMQEKLKHSEMSHQTWTWPDLPKAQETSICRQYQELQMESKEFFLIAFMSMCVHESVAAKIADLLQNWISVKTCR